MYEEDRVLRLLRRRSLRCGRCWVHVLAMENDRVGFLQRDFEHRQDVVELHLVWVIVDGVLVVEKSW